MSREVLEQTIARQYLPSPLWGAVEAKILRQNAALAAPIIPTDELLEASFASGLLALSAAIGNLTHQLDIDRPVYWCITRAKVINAMIAGYRSPDMYCVVVAEAMISTTFAVAAALMTHEPLVEYLRDDLDPVDDHAAPERSRREAWSKIAYDADECLTDAAVLAAVPINYIALHFLMAHEVGHLTGGHLPLCSGGFAIEAADHRTHERKAETRALERDADALAAAATMYLLGNEEFQSAWPQFEGNPAAVLRHFFVTTYMLFSVMDLFGPDDAFSEARTHPPAMVRIGITATMLALTLDQFGAFTKDEIGEVARRSARAVEITVMALGCGMMTKDEVDLIEPSVEENLKEHAEIWTQLRAQMNRTHLDKYWWSRPLR